MSATAKFDYWLLQIFMILLYLVNSLFKVAQVGATDEDSSIIISPYHLIG